MSIRDHVMSTVAMMVAEPGADENTFVPHLIDAGCNPLQAWLLVLLVPIAFGRALFVGRPRMPAKMPEVVAFPAEGWVYYVRLAAIPEFAAAAAAASEGAVPPDQMELVGSRGCELRAIQATVEAGQDLTRSQASAPFLIGVANEPGFLAWFEEFGPQDRDVELS